MSKTNISIYCTTSYFRTLFYFTKNKGFTPYLPNIVYMALFFYNYIIKKI